MQFLVLLQYVTMYTYQKNNNNVTMYELNVQMFVMFVQLITPLHFCFQIIEALSTVPSPELALRLYLQCAEVCYDHDQYSR